MEVQSATKGGGTAMRRRRRMVFNARPHPSPLPQERENHSPRFGDADLLGFGAAFSAQDQEADMTRESPGLSRDAQSCSLSPGERVRVRANLASLLPLKTSTLSPSRLESRPSAQPGKAARQIAWWFFLALSQMIAADRPSSERQIPPPGIPIAEPDRKDLEAGATALAGEIASLRVALKDKPEKLELLPDVEL